MTPVGRMIVVGSEPSAEKDVKMIEIRNVPLTIARTTPKANALEGTTRFTIPCATFL